MEYYGCWYSTFVTELVLRAIEYPCLGVRVSLLNGIYFAVQLSYNVLIHISCNVSCFSLLNKLILYLFSFSLLSLSYVGLEMYRFRHGDPFRHAM